MSNLKSIPWWVWIIPTAFLLVAMARLPYGYYTFTRILVCGIAAWFAIVGWKLLIPDRRFFSGVLV